MTPRPPVAANPEDYVALRPSADGGSVLVAVVRCPSSTHGSRRPVAAVRGTYLPLTASAQAVAYCARCALDLGLAGLFLADRV